ncbi:hypothetical protein BJV74DRAFT_843622 [Russula compacta]|nr:hypothetical protein BJV74DRAFT_843622 [Russula compacta]
MSHVIITGGQGGSAEGALAPNRLEINDLIKDGDHFSLYIQALSKPPFRLYFSFNESIDLQTIAMYDVPQDDSVSHFSMCQ